MKTGSKIGIFKWIVKPATAALAVILTVGTTALPGFAQAIPMTWAWSVYLDQQAAIRTPAGHSITWGDVARFDNFLDHHPDLAQKLYRNPMAIRDPEFLGHHQPLRDYLASNSGIREELAGTPSCLTRRESRFVQMRGTNSAFSRVDLDTLDAYLDGHPDAAGALSTDPSLASDTDFLGHHPVLGLLFRSHPAMAAQLGAHPGWLGWRGDFCHAPGR